MTQRLKILYNSVCPVCREGICLFERRTRTSTAMVEYVDVSQDPHAFEAQGVSLNNVRFKLHAVTPGGGVLRGWPAIAALWRVTPGFKWLAGIGDLPVLRLASKSAYDLTARALWGLNRLQKRW